MHISGGDNIGTVMTSEIMVAVIAAGAGAYTEGWDRAVGEIVPLFGQISQNLVAIY